MTKDTIYLKVPSKPDYISLVRLTTSGIAHNMMLNIDEIEDIKVSIGEACINSLSFNKGEDISIIFEIEEDKLLITVEGVIEEIPEELDKFKEMELGILIIKSLMDKVEFTNTGINMTKYIQ